jgi:hypothetical protein
MTGARLIGVDWATEERNRGVAVVDWEGEGATLVGLSACTRNLTALEVVLGAMEGTALLV